MSLDADQSHAEALRRIEEAARSGASRLDLSRLAIKALPDQIAVLQKLRSVRLAGTQISDVDALAVLPLLLRVDLSGTRVDTLAPLRNLTNLQTLFLSGTPVADLSPLSDLRALRLLFLSNTWVEDLSPLARLYSLQSLRLSGTRVSDLTWLDSHALLRSLALAHTQVTTILPLARLIRLRTLDLANTPVTDLSPIAHLPSLERLNLTGSAVVDLSAVAGITSLSNAAMANRGLRGGIDYKSTPIASSTPFEQLVKLEQPASTVETINYLRRQQGLPEHFPKGYERPYGIDALFADSTSEDVESVGALEQKPANYSFQFREHIFEAAPQTGKPVHPNIATDIRSEVAQKAAAASKRLQLTNAPPRVKSSIAKVSGAIGSSASDLRPGLLLMAYRSIEADVVAYDTETGRQELSEDSLSMLRDLSASIDDLMGCYPELADIEAARVALRLLDADVPRVQGHLLEIRNAADASPVVGATSSNALADADDVIAETTEIIDGPSSESHRTEALKRRAKIIGQKVLDYRNFSARVIRTAKDELGGLAKDTWGEIRKQAPVAIGKGIGKGLKEGSEATTKVALAVLVDAIGGSIAGLATLFGSYLPLSGKIKNLQEGSESEKHPPRPDGSIDA